MREKATLRRRLRRAVSALGALLLALSALVLLLMAGANLPGARRWVAHQASELVSQQIVGNLTVTRLDHIGLMSLNGVHAELTDAAGHRVLAASNVEVELDTWRAALSWFGDGPLELRIARLAAGTINVDLHADHGTEPALLGALEPSASVAENDADAGEAPLRLELEAIALREIEVLGAPAPLEGMELGLRDLAATARMDARSVRFELERARVEATGVPLIDGVAGDLAGTGTLPLGAAAAGQATAEARWLGQLGQIPIEAGLVVAGQDLSGFIRSQAPLRSVLQLWAGEGGAPGLGSAGPVDVLLAFDGPRDDVALRAVVESAGGDVYLDGSVDLERLAGSASVIGDALDLSAWAAVPATSLSFVAALSLARERQTGAVTGRLALRSSPGRIERQPLPELVLSAWLRPRGLEASLRPTPGTDAVLELEVPLGSPPALERVAFEVHACVKELSSALSALGVPAEFSGGGTLSGHGTLELGTEPTLSAGRLRAELRSVVAGGARAARATIDASIEGALARPRIGLHVDARRLSLPDGTPLRDSTLRADLVSEDGALRGQVELSAPRVARLLLRVAELELPAEWGPGALVALDGNIELQAHGDLGQLSRIQGFEGLTGGPVSGTLEGQLMLTGEGRSEPHVHLELATRDLTWASPSGGELARFTWQGIDIDLNVEMAGSLVQARAALVSDERRVIASLRGTAYVPLERALRDPASFDPRSLQLDAELRVPESELGELPPALRFAGVDGLLRAEASLHGRLGRPELSAHVELSELRIAASRRALPLKIVADARLHDEQLSVSAALRDEQRKLASLLGAATVGGGDGPRLRDVELDLRSNGLPVDALGALLGHDVTGELYGALVLKTSGSTPTAEGTLWVNAPSYGGFRQQQARWSIEAGPDAFSSELALEQARGRAHLTLSGPWRWQGASLPSFEPSRVAAELRAEGFDLRALAPLLPEQARGAAGRLDAKLALDPSRPGSARGGARLREGRLYVAALGQEFRDIALDARLDGSGTIALDRLSARALDGRLTASGAIELDGLGFRHATLDVRIPRSDPLPATLDGVMVARAWGRLDVSADGVRGAPGEPPQLNVRVEVPRLHVALPDLTPPDVQELAEDPTIETGTFVEPGRFTTLPLPPYTGAEPEPVGMTLVVRVDVELGSEVWLEQEPALELQVAGGLRLELRDELTLQGQLRLARGNIEVSGKAFQIERGEVTFVPERDPSNPTVIARGVYTAAEGTRVYAEFVGPVETGKLTLRSEPPLRDDQILSLLLFGSADGSFGSSAGEDASAGPWDAVGGTALITGGNVVARGLNRQLRRLTSLDIQTRIGSREGEPQPEVTVQLTPRLTAELAYRLEAPTPSRAPDRTYLTLDLRLFRNWSLSTTIGDAGSFVMDLLWRYRY